MQVKRQPPSNLISFLLLPLIIGGIGYMAILSSVPFNPISMDYNKSQVIFTFIPQGWGFFTRDARELRTLVYSKQGDELNLVNGSASTASELFGLSRESRRENIELGQLISVLPDSIWMNCPSKKWQDCESAPYQIQSPFKNPKFNGEYVLIRTEPVPWAWSSRYASIQMPFSICHIDVVND